ncbi:Protein of unknown function (DUF3176) domain containing protein [Rhypophila decipiens]
MSLVIFVQVIVLIFGHLSPTAPAFGVLKVTRRRGDSNKLPKYRHFVPHILNISSHSQRASNTMSSRNEECSVDIASKAYTQSSVDMKICYCSAETGILRISLRDDPIFDAAHPPFHRRKGVLRGWYPEMICCGISAICLYAIVEVLLVYDENSFPVYPLGITLNSLVALLSSICSMSCTFIVAEGVSQMKWNHFARDKPLADLQAFDSASRGIFGAAKLIFIVPSLRSFPLFLMVVSVMIAGLLSPSMTQSAIGSGLMSSNNASLDVSGHLLEKPEPSELTTAVQHGLATPYYKTIAPTPPTCESGNCEFPKVTTLAVCSEIRNVTNRLSFAPSDVIKPFKITDSLNQHTEGFPSFARNATLPIGAYLTGGQNYFNLNISFSTTTESLGHNTTSWTQRQSMSPTLSFKDRPDLLRRGIVNFFVIWYNEFYLSWRPDTIHTAITLDNPDAGFRASEILLYLCLKEMSASVKGGNPLVNFSNVPMDKESIEIRLESDKAVRPESFVVKEEYFRSLFIYLRGKLRGTFSSYSAKHWTVDRQTTSSELLGDALHSNYRYWVNLPPPTSMKEYDEEQVSRLGTIMKNLAESLTNLIKGISHNDLSRSPLNGRRTNKHENRIRQSSANPPEQDPWRYMSYPKYSSGTQGIYGTAYYHSVVSIRWPFLGLLGSQVLVSIVFLICVIRQSKRLGVELHKSQLLPVLLAIPPAIRPRLIRAEQRPGSPNQAHKAMEEHMKEQTHQQTSEQQDKVTSVVSTASSLPILGG